MYKRQLHSVIADLVHLIDNRKHLLGCHSRSKQRLMSVTTVSYTHLDVYKRQVYLQAILISIIEANSLMDVLQSDSPSAVPSEFCILFILSLIHI